MPKRKPKARGPARTQSSPEPAKLYRASEELKEWAGMLAAELATWPRVRSKPMFGLVGFYRGQKIFAALPRTRALTSPHSIIFKFHAENAATRRARKRLHAYPAAKWVSFELRSPEDLSPALQWLDLAYR
ncbi:MAG: luciferase family protein, partial [Candidatus Acidiferrales bacterium]